MDKSYSESNLANQDERLESPLSYISQRVNKRRREDDFDAFREEMIATIKSMLLTQETELKKITPTLMEIKLTNANIENTMAAISLQNEEFKRKIEEMELQAKKDKEYISILEEKVEDLQRGSRKSNIEIKNVPKQLKETKEDLIEMVVCLTKTVNNEITKSDIRDIYRVKGKKQGMTNTPIIVELSSTILKTEVLKMCKSYNTRNVGKLSAKHLGLKNNVDVPIFVSEQLTAKGSRLHFLARDLAKSKGFKYCWTAYGKVYVKKRDESPTYLIRSESQIQSLMQEP
ncbi:uncharacterized protein LOC142985825 [Anticarsia gemmatalis]|uniref:uncharacterized protein LOC142973299 n=1 Tax=Anticarsia gemmatalis TaxID=129554 RepID=UPI003F75CED2